jgi:hypothetical protein
VHSTLAAVSLARKTASIGEELDRENDEAG